MKAAIVGMGRMGRMLDEVLSSAGHTVVARIGSDGGGGGDGGGKGNTLADMLGSSQADMAFEFTTPSSACENVETLLRLGIPTVCGTTGWDSSGIDGIDALAREHRVPVMVAANFSIGVAVMRKLAERAASLLRPFDDFEAGIIERHHRAKRDAPSGTARMLGEAVSQSGHKKEIPIVALRLGGQPGEHTIVFEGPSECVSLTHRARSHRVFAAGAVRVAEWLAREGTCGLVSFDTFLERTESW